MTNRGFLRFDCTEGGELALGLGLGLGIELELGSELGLGLTAELSPAGCLVKNEVI